MCTYCTYFFTSCTCFLQRTVEGKITPGAKCLIVEDVIVSGTSVMETVSVLKKEGMEVNMAVLLLDRQQGGKQNLKEKGITAYRCETMSTNF